VNLLNEIKYAIKRSWDKEYVVYDETTLMYAVADERRIDGLIEELAPEQIKGLRLRILWRTKDKEKIKRYLKKAQWAS